MTGSAQSVNGKSPGSGTDWPDEAGLGGTGCRGCVRGRPMPGLAPWPRFCLSAPRRIGNLPAWAGARTLALSLTAVAVVATMCYQFERGGLTDPVMLIAQGSIILAIGIAIVGARGSRQVVTRRAGLA
jgi:hypothetical protein